FPSFFSPQPIQENRAMPATPASANGSFNASTNRQEIKAVTNRNREQENDAIECALPVANKIIEEAIRNERPLSDVVRRIIALPVANPESVQIPILLADADFQLLAIRYGLPASDKNSIRNRIIEEINEFCGSRKQ